MSRDTIRWRLLVSAAEDFEPLFHALWEFGVPADPQPGAPSADEIKAVLWELIDEGLIELYQGQTPDGEFVPMGADRRPTVFQSPDSWRVYEDPANDVRYSTTAAGDEAVRRPPQGADEPA